MLIEIRKAGFVNKGAELMLYAIQQKMKEAFPNAQFAMAPTANNGSAPFNKRAELGLLQKAWLWRYGFQWGDLATLAPPKIREMYGVVLDKEIDVVLDASGFSYSDQWGDGSSQELANSCKRWTKRRTKVVLLPQAFGPFTSPKIKSAIKTAVDNADLIFARESISYSHLTELVGERPNIKIAPDFTNLITGTLPSDFDIENKRFCIVPNHHMIGKMPKDKSETYLPFIIKCVQYLLEKKQKPFVLIHEGAADLKLGQEISEAVGGELPVVCETDPLKIKGILGASDGVISSRFHASASALSQGVPSLATGWSHKYQMLFEDYGFAEGVLSTTADDKEIFHKIDRIIDNVGGMELRGLLAARSEETKKKSEAMWADVIDVINRKDD